MTVRIEKDGPVWTVIHDRPQARNAMDPESADALTAAFLNSMATRMRPLRCSTARAAHFAPAGISNT
jgi:enoyl-CoA hydratase/carnithine racemase